jgi:hypothetical protein
VEVFQDGSSSYTAHPKDLDMLHAIFAAPCLTTFCRLDELGLEAVGQRLEPDQAVIECRVAEPRSPISGQHCREALLQILDKILGNLQRREMSPGFGRPPSDDLSVPLLCPGTRTLFDVAGIYTDC